MLILSLSITQTINEAIPSRCFYDRFDEPNMSLIEPAGYAFITETGLANYMTKNQLGVLANMAGQQLIESIDMKMIGFKLTIQNVKVVTITPPLVFISLDPLSQQGKISFENLSLDLGLIFQLNQVSWPFLEDHGTGRIQLLKVEFSTTLTFVDSECPDMYNFQKINAKFKVKSLQISLTGSLSYIYNSILDLISGQLTNLLNTVLAQPTVDVIISGLNAQMDVWYNRAGVNLSMVVSDGRWLNKPKMVDRGMYLDISFQRCLLEANSSHGDRCVGNYSEKMTFRPDFLTNSEMQTYASRAAFNAGFELFREHKKVVQLAGKEYSIVKFHTPKIENTGVRINLLLENSGEEVEIRFFTNITANEVNVKDYMFQLHFDQESVFPDTIPAEDQASFIQSLRKDFYNYQLTYTNMENYDWGTFYIVYINSDWIVSNVDLKK